MKYKDCMIDFETLATVPHAVVLQLGWAFFNADEPGGAMDTGQVLFGLPHQVARRRELDPETWAWWLTQDKDLFRKLLQGDEDIPQALSVFDTAWKAHAQFKTTLWSNGANFDEPILSNLYRTNGLKMPGHYSASRCVRTIKALCPSVPMVKPELKHDGESDSIAQAKFVQNCYAHLALFNKVAKHTSESAEQILAREAANQANTGD